VVLVKISKIERIDSVLQVLGVVSWH
jgi:hypothetical protein